MHHHIIDPFTPMEVHHFNENRMDDCLSEITMKIHVEITDKTNQAIVDAVVEAAREAGITDLYILDKKFVIDALCEKIAREKYDV